jgi:hypothetical protein
MAIRLVGLMGLFLIVALCFFVSVVDKASADEIVTALPMQWNFAKYIEAAAYVVSGAATLAAVLPIPERARGMIAIARNILDTLALNIGNAKNKK